MSARHGIALACSGLLAGGGVLAQSFPVKPVRIIVAFPAGGGTDITARVIAQKVSETIGRNVFVDNRVGGSMIGDVVAVTDTGYELLTQHPRELASW